jgi:hypothetical protein
MGVAGDDLSAGLADIVKTRVGYGPVGFAGT